MTTLAHKIPMEVVSKILLMRPTHPTAKLIKDYAEYHITSQFDMVDADDGVIDDICDRYHSGKDISEEEYHNVGIFTWDYLIMSQCSYEIKPWDKEAIDPYNDEIKTQKE